MKSKRSPLTTWVELMVTKLFEEALAATLSEEVLQPIRLVLQERFLDVKNIHQSNEKEDRQGIDFWVEQSNGKMITVDCKIRTKDYAYLGDDSLAIETWSNVEKFKRGWSRDPTKKSDYILWYWLDSHRHVLFPFPLLCKVVVENWIRWGAIYKLSHQKTAFKDSNEIYHSECIFVPRLEILRKIANEFGGNL